MLYNLDIFKLNRARLAVHVAGSSYIFSIQTREWHPSSRKLTAKWTERSVSSQIGDILDVYSNFPNLFGARLRRLVHWNFREKHISPSSSDWEVCPQKPGKHQQAFRGTELCKLLSLTPCWNCQRAKNYLVQSWNKSAQ